jgi:hypothetical protein
LTLLGQSHIIIEGHVPRCNNNHAPTATYAACCCCLQRHKVATNHQLRLLTSVRHTPPLAPFLMRWRAVATANERLHAHPAAAEPRRRHGPKIPTQRACPRQTTPVWSRPLCVRGARVGDRSGGFVFATGDARELFVRSRSAPTAPPPTPGACFGGPRPPAPPPPCCVEDPDVSASGTAGLAVGVVSHTPSIRRRKSSAPVEQSAGWSRDISSPLEICCGREPVRSESVRTSQKLAPTSGADCSSPLPVSTRSYARGRRRHAHMACMPAVPTLGSGAAAACVPPRRRRGSACPPTTTYCPRPRAVPSRPGRQRRGLVAILNTLARQTVPYRYGSSTYVDLPMPLPEVWLTSEDNLTTAFLVKFRS